MVQGVLSMREIVLLISLPLLVLTEACNIGRGIERRANEDGAITTMQKLRDAEAQCERRHGKGQYCQLDQLIRENLLPPDLANGKKNGYEFIINIDDGRY